MTKIANPTASEIKMIKKIDSLLKRAEDINTKLLVKCGDKILRLQ